MVIAFAVLVTVFVPVSAILTNSLTQAANARYETAALSLAEQWIEQLNNSGPPLNVQGLPEVGTPISEGVQIEAGVKFSVSALFNWATVNGTVDLCTSSTVPQVLDLQVTVSWGRRGSVSDTTILNYPPASVPTNGFIGVQLEGDPSGTGDPEPSDVEGRAWGGPAGRVTTVPVTVTLGAKTYTAYPGSDGCAFFEVPPGTYSVKIGPDTLNTPFVAPGSAATTVSATATVATNQLTEPGPFLYDEGTYVDVAYPDTTVTDGLVACPNDGKVRCIVTGQAPVGATPNGTTGTVATVSVLTGSSWSTQALPTSLGIAKVESVTCASLCVAVGFGASGSAAAISMSPTAPSTWTAATLPAGTVTLNDVVCETPTACLAVGANASGAVVLGGTATGGRMTWVADTLPAGTASLTALTCPSAACLAVGKGTSGPVVLAGSASGGAQTWVADTVPTGVTALTALACPGTAACLAVGRAGSAAAVIAGAQSATTETWVADTLPAGTASLTQLACAGTAACVAIGTSTGGPLLLAGGQSATAESWVEDALPTGIAALSGLTCAGKAAACLAVDSTSSGDGIVAGPLAASAHTWVSDGLPTGVTTVTALTCSTAGPTCVATGTSTSSNDAVVVTGTPSASSQTFVDGTLAGGATTLFYAGVACTSSTPLLCAADGASATAAMLVDDPATQAGPTSWAAEAVQGTSGLVAADLPITVSNSEPAGSSWVACAAGHCSGTVGPLFPFASGYAIGAGQCQAELGNGSAHAKSLPGTTQALATRLTLPLGLLAVKVVNGSGAPLAGASVTATVADPTVPLDASCNGMASTVGTTGPDGTVALDVVYETYTLAVNGTTVATVAVTPTSIIESPASSPVSYPLPSPVVVS